MTLFEGTKCIAQGTTGRRGLTLCILTLVPWPLCLVIYLALMNRVYLKRKISHRIAGGHPWVFGNEIGKMDDGIKAGDIVEVCYHDGKFVGKGYINPKSQILVRLL